MESLVFSKNRPMQLELCLRSHQKFWGEDITVLYKADPEYQEGYDILVQQYPRVKFQKEDNFKQQVVDYVKSTKYSVFFVDDDVMIRPFNEACPEMMSLEKNPETLLCLSMRLDKRYSRHFETGETVPVPPMEGNTWEWRKAWYDWGFAMSVVGHIFRSSDLLPLVEGLFYNSPNQLESVLSKGPKVTANNPLSQPRMMCFDEAKNINIPANLVQATHHNKAGKVSVSGLNRRFLRGERIDLDDIVAKAMKAKSCFFLPKYKFIKGEK